jgi:hypothetical protein
LAFIAAVLPHWVVPMVAPPPPADQLIVDVGHRLKDRLLARIKGVEVQAPQHEPPFGNQLMTAVTLGLLAIALAVLALVFREEKLMAGVAAVLGAGALIVEISPFIVGMIVVIMFIYAVLNLIGLL